jgi:hypothetical protein
VGTGKDRDTHNIFSIIKEVTEEEVNLEKHIDFTVMRKTLLT